MTPLTNLIQPYIHIHDTVLDLGCGIMTPTTDLTCKHILGVDLYAKYLDVVKTKHSTLLLDVTELDRFPSDSYDVVLALDVIEHLPHDVAIKFMQGLKRIARKYAFIFTPKTFHTNKENTHNVWNLGENTLQSHRCLVTKMEMGENEFVRIQTSSYPNMVLAKYSKSE